MIDFFFINRILVIIISAIGVWLGAFVYFSNKKSEINRVFLVMIFCALSWIILCYFSGILVDNLDLSLLFARIAYGTTALFFVPFYHFFSIFTKIKTPKFLKLFIPLASITIFFLSVFTDFIALEMVEASIMGISIGVVPAVGLGKFLYFSFVLLITFLVVVKILKKHFYASQKEKTKLHYFLLGIIIFVITNLVFNVLLVLGTGDARYYQIGNYSIIFFLGFTALAIVKNELFEIKVVITGILVSLIGILLFADLLLLTDVFWIQIAKFIVLLIFLGFGWALVKSVIKEIKQREQLERLAREIEQANRELKKLDQAKSDFLSIASHQLRTPLTAMRGYLSMLTKGDFGPISPKVREVSREVYQASLRLLKLSNDLLNVSQIESGKTTLSYEMTSIEKMVKSVIDEIKIEADRKNLYLKMITADDLPEVEIDSDKIRQSLLNIIDNALKYTKQGGVTVQIGLSGSNHILIKVKDTGVGLSKEDIGKLFRSFSRGQAGISLHSAGAGLGLYVARKFVDQHKGRLWVESPGRNQGSTFFIELPIKRG